jgi:hypothetical protein
MKDFLTTQAARFWDVFEKSTITQFTITASVVGTWCWMVAHGQSVPEDFKLIAAGCVTFFFSNKAHLSSKTNKES